MTKATSSTVLPPVKLPTMESAMKLKVPLKVEISEAENWYEAK